VSRNFITKKGISAAKELPQIFEDFEGQPVYDYTLSRWTQFLEQRLDRMKDIKDTQPTYQTASAIDKKEINITVCLTVSEKDWDKIPGLLRVAKDWLDGKLVP
jgi:hypothetical protein